MPVLGAAMLSSGSGGGGGAGLVDSRIGSIVWVRRRNGSWWPGKILGADELSASRLMSPRSGTPVKLLGREDASVDWYNLEKSKRVKTFRCGEFDDCIERAEATLGVRSKKREKYARREDAILHALELEKELVEKKYGKVGANSSINNNSCGSAGKDLHTSLGALGNGNGKHESMKLQQFNKIVVLPGEDECNSNLLSTHKGDGGTWRSSVKSESSSLIGGSQDFTISKKIVSVALSPVHKAASDDQAQVVSAAGIYLGSCGDVDSGNSMDKGKGLLDRTIEESSIKRRDRRRPLVQVLQNATIWHGHSLQPEGDTFSMSVVNDLGEDAQAKRRRLSYLHPQFTDILDMKADTCSQMENVAPHQGVVCHSHSDAFAKDAILESSEDIESDSDSSETDSMDHYTNVEMTTYSDVNAPMVLESTALNSLEMRGDHASTSCEESSESFPHEPQFLQKNPISLDMGVSRWQMKGKRNVRSISRRSFDKFTYGTYLEPNSLVQRENRNSSHWHGHDGYNNEVDFIKNSPEHHIEGYGRKGNMLKPQAASRRCNLVGSNMVGWEELTWRDSSFRGYSGDGFGSYNSLYGGLHGQELLLDVELKVQPNHRREHVPFVSLMSRLNGKPIIGHPIQIETLGDGSTDDLVSSVDTFENLKSDDVDRVPPVWTRARRTANFRVPHPHLSSQLDDVDNQHVDQDPKSQFTNSVSGNTSAKKKNVARQKSPHVPKAPSSERKKPPKRSISSSCQKIRPLSSLGMDQKKLVFEPRHSGLNRYMDGEMKPLDSGPPTVACIPVKLVFSRLLEAIGRPPSSHNSQGFL